MNITETNTMNITETNTMNITETNTMNITVPKESLTDRLLMTFPSGTYCLPALLSLAEIVETTEVETAAVQCQLRPKMYINPVWCAQHADTAEKLVMLTMHELHHIVLGHTRLYPRVNVIDNLVFDAIINSMLCHLFPEPSYMALLTDFYQESNFPECMLRPPSNWRPGALVRAPKALQCKNRKHLIALYKKIYSEQGATYEELHKALSDYEEANAFNLKNLLGDHSDETYNSSSSGNLASRSPEMLEQVRKMVEHWPRPVNPIIGRAIHQFLERTHVVITPPTNRSSLVHLFQKVANIKSGGAVRCITNHTTWVEAPIPRMDRRAVVMGALGQRPTLYRHPLNIRRMRPCGERVHVYLDVSGSVQSIIGALYSAIINCSQFVHPTVHLFSTEVADATLNQLRKGYCNSTGGTNIECVAEHMQRNKIRRAVLVTDGYVGTPGALSNQVLQNSLLGVALTPGHSTRSDLHAFVKHWTQLTKATS